MSQNLQYFLYGFFFLYFLNDFTLCIEQALGVQGSLESRKAKACNKCNNAGLS